MNSKVLQEIFCILKEKLEEDSESGNTLSNWEIRFVKMNNMVYILF